MASYLEIGPKRQSTTLSSDEREALLVKSQANFERATSERECDYSPVALMRSMEHQAKARIELGEDASGLIERIERLDDFADDFPIHRKTATLVRLRVLNNQAEQAFPLITHENGLNEFFRFDMHILNARVQRTRGGDPHSSLDKANEAVEEMGRCGYRDIQLVGAYRDLAIAEYESGRDPDPYLMKALEVLPKRNNGTESWWVAIAFAKCGQLDKAFSLRDSVMGYNSWETRDQRSHIAEIVAAESIKHGELEQATRAAMLVSPNVFGAKIWADRALAEQAGGQPFRKSEESAYRILSGRVGHRSGSVNKRAEVYSRLAKLYRGEHYFSSALFEINGAESRIGPFEYPNSAMSDRLYKERALGLVTVGRYAHELGFDAERVLDQACDLAGRIRESYPIAEAGVGGINSWQVVYTAISELIKQGYIDAGERRVASIPRSPFFKTILLTDLAVAQQIAANS